MGSRASTNFCKAFGQLEHYNDEVTQNIQTREDLLDKMEVSISDYLVKIGDRELTENENRQITELLKLIGEYERIGDYSINILECAQRVQDRELHFSSAAKQELELLYQAVKEILQLTTGAFSGADLAKAEQVEPLEETVDQICLAMRERHILRLKSGRCELEAGIVFLDIVTNAERVSDHCSNIAGRLVGNELDVDAHARKQALHAGSRPEYNRILEDYRQKYLALLPQIS